MPFVSSYAFLIIVQGFVFLSILVIAREKDGVSAAFKVYKDLHF